MAPPKGGVSNEDPKLVAFLADYRPSDSMSIEIAPSEVTIVDARGRRKPWYPNAKPVQEAQMEGGVVVFSAKWKGQALVLERSTPEVLAVRREFRLLDDGRSLEVKAFLVRWRSTEERRYVYTRMEP